MAYKRCARPRCQATGNDCPRKPEFIVFMGEREDDDSKPVGAYCKRHASQAVQLLAKIERTPSAKR